MLPLFGERDRVLLLFDLSSDCGPIEDDFVSLGDLLGDLAMVGDLPLEPKLGEALSSIAG